MAQNRELMRAIIMENIGGPRVLNYVRLARPVPGAGEVLVKIHATSINPCDLHHRRGRFVLRKPMPHILGARTWLARLSSSPRMWQAGTSATAFAPVLNG